MINFPKIEAIVGEQRLLEMIDMYLAGELTGEQQIELDQWYASFENKKGLFEENSVAMRKLAAMKFSELSKKLFSKEAEMIEHMT